MGGGVPIGVCIAGTRADVFEPGDHGSTFGGNPLACAAAVATLEVISSEDLVGNAARVGRYLEQREVEKLAPFGVGRGRGLMQALVLHQDVAQQVQATALGNGLIVNAIGANVLRMVPPLTIGEQEVDRAIAILETSLDEVSAHVRTPGAPGA